MSQENLSSGFLTRSDTNQAVQPQKIARDLKFQTWEVEGLYYLCSENKGADQLRFKCAALLICAFVFAYVKIRFSQHAAQLKLNLSGYGSSPHPK